MIKIINFISTDWMFKQMSNEGTTDLHDLSISIKC